MGYFSGHAIMQDYLGPFDALLFPKYAVRTHTYLPYQPTFLLIFHVTAHAKVTSRNFKIVKKL